MQPSPTEIQREVEALRDIRRRSTQGGPGTLVLDPDLPHESSPTSTTAGYWTSGTNPGLTDGDSSSSSHEDGLGSDRSSAEDPFHLFWVPARLHPEIAPTEFRAFLKEHARGPPADGSASLSRSNSAASVSSSSGLGRRTSMLSRQYRPTEAEGTEEEEIVPLRRNRSSIYNPGPQLTINDLQKLEELAEEASQSDDPTRLRSILRRSLSLNVAPSAMDTMDNMPEEDADAPIIVPRPGQILRRAARTKIRKPGLPGDGGGHRFGQSTRRGTTGGSGGRIAPMIDQRTSSDMSSSDHSEAMDSPGSPKRRIFSETLTDEPSAQRPDSYSEEASSIFDAYVREDLDEDESRTVVPSPVTESRPPPIAVVSPLSPASIELPLSPPLPTLQFQSEPIVIPIPLTLPSASPVIHQPQPQRVATLRPPTQELRTTSPDSLRSAEGTNSRSHSPGSEHSSFLSTSPTPKKDKDKKGLFGFGRDKGSKKANKEKEREREREQRERVEREREEEKKSEKEKESGFFGSLFGGKKKQDDGASQMGGRETSAALLGSKANKSYVPPTSPQFAGVGGSYARYPIHVERAIYRLSHIKLANPRRPLYEQVLISNLMFWYLGVINKTQVSVSPSSPPPGQPADKEREQKEAEERQKAEREEKEKERLEQEKEKEREREQQKKEAPRRGSLTKAPSAGAPGGRRAAEMPVKGPQYGMQHREIEQEWGGYGAGQAPSMPPRSNTMPVGGQARPGPAQSADVYYTAGGNQTPRTQKPHLPPGAMPPISSDQQMSWLSTPPATSPPKARRPSSPPSPPSTAPVTPNSRRSRSPPPHNQNRFVPSPIHMPEMYNGQPPVAGGSVPSRSRSATALAPPTHPPAQVNGKLRKNSSAQAVMANTGRKPRRSDTALISPGGEDEDMPLGMWQQRQRRR